MSEPIACLSASFADYRRHWPAEADVVDLFEQLLADGVDAFARTHLPGHFTGSAWLVDASGRRVLLTHHRKLDRWLQLGGHADGDPDAVRVALREAEEESGLHGLSIEPTLFDLDRHLIPARATDPEHYHYDLRYVVRAAAGGEDFVVSDESHALAWRPIVELVDEASADASVRRMARKWLERG